MAVVITTTAIFFALVLSACDRRENARWQGSTMGTTYSVVAANFPSNLDKDEVRVEIEKLLEAVNSSMSTYIDTSELSKINRSSSIDWMSISPELMSVLEIAQNISLRSSGAYDITIGPLVNLWGFGPGSGYGDNIPAAVDINSARQRVGFKKLELKPDSLELKKATRDLYLDLSSIAKGYGVDKIAELLVDRGVADFMVEVGGELRVQGYSPRGNSWKIAIEQPEAGRSDIQRVLEVKDVAIATSGDYRNYFEKDGVRYSHTIDGMSGEPVKHRLASVTVIAKTATVADGWATALLVMGENDGFRLASQLNLVAYFIYKDGQAFKTKETESFGRLFSVKATN